MDPGIAAIVKRYTTIAVRTEQSSPHSCADSTSEERLTRYAARG